MQSFVHLHVHSHYSLLEASAQVSDLVARAKSFSMPAVALTDNGALFGAIEFYLACKESGVKPIIGMDAYLVEGDFREKKERNFQRLVLLAQDQTGYRNLCRLSTIGFREGFYYKPRIDLNVLAAHKEGLLVLSGGIDGLVTQDFLRRGPEKALEKVRHLAQIFPESFYLELNRNGLNEWTTINKFMVEAAQIVGLPLVATNDVYYLNRDDRMAQEVLVCIGTNKTLQDETRFTLGSDQFYFKSSEQMRNLFQDLPQALDATLEIAERCEVKFKFKDAQGKTIYHLPSFPVSQGRTLGEEISRLAHQGLNERFEELVSRGESPSEENKPHYVERLGYELSVINEMGFNGYFLIVQDFINWAKAQGIPVGPGRGSGAGSLVAYSLKITDLDPVRHKIVFERFLNPERISMPDFDIDFCQDRRAEVLNYVSQKYGEQSVSQIITFGKLQARAALRDVGRVLGMTYSEVDVIAKLIPEKLGITLKEAIELEPRLREQEEIDPRVGSLLKLAQDIEGLVRHAGIHAAGVIIADGNLVDYAPLYRGLEGENVIQYDMKHAEKIGLIKFDFLGLKTLTHIQNALDLIFANRTQKIATKDIPISDPGIYELLSRGDTAGVFQFEGEGITDLIRQIQPSCFEDITAINALYRPGPMEMIPEYTARKLGQKSVDYIFPELAEILGETYGVIVYQEQVLLIAAKIAGYSLGEADLLRRAMGKKIAEEMAKQRDRFIRGGEANKYDRVRVEELFDLMQEFAKYGFNKAHAAAYCVLAAQTAWLKCKYPVEFYAALLSTEMQDADKVVRYIKDAQQHNIRVEPPHINYSDYKFTVKGETLYFGLGAIKGVGTSAVDAILETRRRQPGGVFKSLDHFFEQVDLRRINKKVIECLIKSGALDAFGFHRAQLMNGYSRFLESAEITRRDRERGQFSLFSLMSEAEQNEQVVLEECASWSRAQSLAFEKEVLGFFLSDHPLRGFDKLFRGLVTSNIADLNREPDGKGVRLVGMVSELREVITKKGTRMAFVTLDDHFASVDVVVFPDTYAECERILKAEEPLVLTGKLENQEGSPKIIAEELSLLEQSFNKMRRVTLQVDDFVSEHFEEIKSVMQSHPGSTAFSLKIPLPDLGKTVIYDVQSPAGVRLGKAFFDHLHAEIGRTDFIEA